MPPRPPSLLSPYSPTTAHPADAASPLIPPNERPSSWMSVSSAGSGDVFDAELFDAFPSVPGDMPSSTAPYHSSRYQSLPPLAAAFSGHNQQTQDVRRAHTVSGRPHARS
ncbi:hypothetical protein PHLCEN_2v7769 [Hermanssonia centrifuga]|uniref:Uncharacterized protein n=1 Tax=Hermanssonia centrifuga TaxID=98765 RepID=A0A2R6NW03_9APHY|nr:hypothetical protein PHLCEN_2v7769 [Hermanssonia centrifuga]